MSVLQSSVARDRILSFLDEGSFVELYESVTCRHTDLSLKECEEQSDGVVTGYGLMDGRLVFLYSQNPEVLHGSLGEMHCKKIVELYTQALKMGAPVIALLDSSGLRLQEGVDALTGLGEVLSAVNEASGVIPMYSVIYGNCGGGLSIIPALSDFTYMVEGKGRLFVNSPNAIDANYQEKMDTADGKFKELYSGIVDECLPEEEIQAKVRRLLQLLPGNNTEGIYTGDCQDDLNRLIVEMNASNYETKVLLSNLGDGYEFLETKCEYAPDMITGFIQLNGMTIGTIANREDSERLTVDGLLKGTDFVRFCDAYDIPLLVVADTCGFETSMVAEKAIGRSMASFVSALCEADVPKVTLLPHKAMGSAYLLMNSKSMGADFVYAWPDAELGILPAKEAVEILYATEQNIDKAQKQASYEQTHNSVSAFAKRAQIDRVIDPESTRKYLVSAFDLLYTKYSCVQDKKHNLR